MIRSLRIGTAGTLAAAMLLGAACAPDETPSSPAVSGGFPAATSPAPAPSADERPVILAFGDSLTSGEGVDPDLSYPSQLQGELDRGGYGYRVVNLGIRGDTTSSALARLDSALAIRPEIVILELGGNDGLRGIPIDVAERNLSTMIEAFKEAGSRVILAGLTLPRNYGPDYIREFETMYVDLAEAHGVERIRFFLEGLVDPDNPLDDDFRFMQPDGIHPTAEGYTIVAASVLKEIEPYLSR